MASAHFVTDSNYYRYTLYIFLVVVKEIHASKKKRAHKIVSPFVGDEMSSIFYCSLKARTYTELKPETKTRYKCEKGKIRFKDATHAHIRYTP